MENLSPNNKLDPISKLTVSAKTVDDFDLLIGVTSVTHHLTMVTNNTNHFKRITGIKLEDSAKEYLSLDISLSFALQA